MNDAAAPKQTLTPTKILLIIAGAVLVIAVVFMIINEETAYSYNGVLYDPPEPAPAFTLINQDNEVTSLSDFQGNVVLIFFGYTHCPEACPTTLVIWRQVLASLGEDGDQVRFVFITVDPEQDTPEQIKKHLSNFSPEFIGLSGSLTEIKEVADDYDIYYKKEAIDSAANYQVSHTTTTIVLDREGMAVLVFPYATNAEEITSDLKHLLEQ